MQNGRIADFTLVIAAAARVGCTRVLTDDLNSGQTIMGVVVENPLT